MNQLYRKVLHGKQVRYEAYTEPPLILSDDMTEGQLVSCIGGLASGRLEQELQQSGLFTQPKIHKEWQQADLMRAAA